MPKNSFFCIGYTTDLVPFVEKKPVYQLIYIDTRAENQLTVKHVRIWTLNSILLIYMPATTVTQFFLLQ